MVLKPKTKEERQELLIVRIAVALELVFPESDHDDLMDLSRLLIQHRDLANLSSIERSMVHAKITGITHRLMHSQAGSTNAEVQQRIITSFNDAIEVVVKERTDELEALTLEYTKNHAKLWDEIRADVIQLQNEQFRASFYEGKEQEEYLDQLEPLRKKIQEKRVALHQLKCDYDAQALDLITGL